MTTILLIVEGEKTEPSILEKLKSCFFSNENAVQRISICFKTDIFEFYDALKEGDGFLDPFRVLQERNSEACKEIISSEEIAAIYLFFDHDIHADRGLTYDEKSEKIKELLVFFDNETENGLLLISYPMIEAYKDWDETGKNCFSCLSDTRNNNLYKEKVRSRHTNHDHKNFFNFDKWNSLSRIMLSRAFFLVDGNHDDISYGYMQDRITQLAIFESQNTKFIERYQYVVILSPIPFFLCIELGRAFYNRHIKDSLQCLDCNHTCIVHGKIPTQFSL